MGEDGEAMSAGRLLGKLGFEGSVTLGFLPITQLSMSGSAPR